MKVKTLSDVINLNYNGVEAYNIYDFISVILILW